MVALKCRKDKEFRVKRKCWFKLCDLWAVSLSRSFNLSEGFPSTHHPSTYPPTVYGALTFCQVLGLQNTDGKNLPLSKQANQMSFKTKCNSSHFMSLDLETLRNWNEWFGEGSTDIHSSGHPGNWMRTENILAILNWNLAFPVIMNSGHSSINWTCDFATKINQITFSPFIVAADISKYCLCSFPLWSYGSDCC